MIDYALADLDDRRWDDEAPVEGDRDDVANPAALLAQVRFAWSSFVSIFLITDDNAQSGLIRRDVWARTLRWLKAVEDMTRGLLLTMALALPAGRTPPARPASKAAPRPPRALVKFPRTSLSVVGWLLAPEAGSSAAVAPKIAPDTAPAPLLVAMRGWRSANRWHAIRGLVCRTEALLRILNRPEPFARRVALRLDGLNRPLRCPIHPPPAPAPPGGRNREIEDPAPGAPYRFVLAPLWAHCAALVAAREHPG